MGYLNQDIREGSFDEIGASGTLDGMCEGYVPSWDHVDEKSMEALSRSMKILDDEFVKKESDRSWDVIMGLDNAG